MHSEALARQLLDNTDLPISKIASALHYTDPNALFRAFRQWARLSPSQWRARQERSNNPRSCFHLAG
jgi:AraC-like DNA-binding protein